ncbi:DUF4880 domain-containing protein [Pusillimonas caeni]|uniref:FecR family protein n=1 Tax=Pusillimonas caeni TaxID=1348472 RepID=UPI000E59DE2F|nr:FecR domain-containing protein [Pusillimonas caeni]TFL11521.1 DUF4880 domain-containing protein [Pusillimonas caeni]
MTAESPNLPHDPRDAAAYWFARVHSGSFTVAERERFTQWRQADIRHEREYRALDEIWQATGMLPEDDLRELLQAPEPPAELRRLSRRRWLVAAGSAGAAVIAGGVFFYGHGAESPTHVLRYATVQGERRKASLPDGSIIELNVSTELAVSYYAKRRVVELAAGEATFSVAANPHRPFFVAAADVEVRVTGTIFNVRRESDRVSVAVQEGSVEVTSGHWWSREKAMLTANTAVHAAPGLPLAAERVDVAALTAWRRGKAVFREQLLEDVLQEMNRYLSHPIHVTDSRLKRLRMAGVFSIEDAEGFLQALQGQLPVAVTRRPDGGVDLSLLR